MKTLLLAAILGVAGFTTDLRADYLVSGSKGSLGGSANFSISNGTLIITLTDTSTVAAGSVGVGQVLTGVYFNVKSGTNPGFTATGATAAVPAGTVAIDGNQTVTLNSSTNAAGAWGFDKGLGNTPYGMPYGFIATAMSSSCQGAACGTTLSGSNLTANSVYGGLVNNGGANVNQWVDRNSIIFSLKLPQNTTFTTTDISSVAFQFGDAGLGETDFQVLPEPVSYSGAIALLLVPVLWYKRKRRAAPNTAA